MTTWIYTDADNTLWDTDGLYADAQLFLLSAAEGFSTRLAPTKSRLEFVRQFDQEIALRHHAGLRYPPALLLRALVDGLEGASPDEAAAKAVNFGYEPNNKEVGAIRHFSERVATLPDLLPTVKNGLEAARHMKQPVYVVTEGSDELLKKRLVAHGIQHLFSGAISASKNVDLYVRLKKRAGPNRSVMIGDQADRDVRLAKAAGMDAILVPSRFRPSWTADADAALADIVVRDFAEAIEWIASRNKWLI